jgi:Fis family transcriptional regulator
LADDRHSDAELILATRALLDAELAGTSLAECVTGALARYFALLDGQHTTDLYALVLREVEAPLFRAVLGYTGGNQCRAAEMLGLNRGTLRKKMKQYDLL